MDSGRPVFPTIVHPDDWDVYLGDCRIDLKNKEQTLSFKQCTQEYDLWFELEDCRLRFTILTFTIDMIKAGKIYDRDPGEEGAVLLTLESPVVKQWLASERVKWSKSDHEQMHYFYKLIDDYQSSSGSSWEQTTDTETRKVAYKQEEGKSVYTMLTDTIINTDVKNLVACFEQAEILVDMFTTFSEVRWVKRIGDQSGLIYSRQKIPWPLSDRDLCFHISCIIDRKN